MTVLGILEDATGAYGCFYMLGMPPMAAVSASFSKLTHQSSTRTNRYQRTISFYTVEIPAYPFNTSQSLLTNKQ